jgi:hypothetical protein
MPRIESKQILVVNNLSLRLGTELTAGTTNYCNRSTPDLLYKDELHYCSDRSCCKRNNPTGTPQFPRCGETLEHRAFGSSVDLLRAHGATTRSVRRSDYGGVEE